MVQMVYQIPDDVTELMRPWMYQLVKECLEKASEDNDEIALQAFRSICDVNVLSNQTDRASLEHIKLQLHNSPSKNKYIDAIQNVVENIYGAVEGF